MWQKVREIWQQLRKILMAEIREICMAAIRKIFMAEIREIFLMAEIREICMAKIRKICMEIICIQLASEGNFLSRTCERLELSVGLRPHI